jgi:hypothetical protein
MSGDEDMPTDTQTYGTVQGGLFSNPISFGSGEEFKDFAEEAAPQ